ncbi:hypothetical protein R0E42_005559 [Klebsiella variicola]|nr:hypothetical protein [Klebsiella variicola]
MNTSEKKTKYLPLEFCHVDKAASMLGCGIDDIFHWAEVGAIRLSIRLEYFPSFLSFKSLTEISSQNLFDSLLTSENEVRLSGSRRVTYFYPDRLETEIYRDDSKLYVKGWACGLWAIPKKDVSKLYMKGEIEIDSLLYPDEHRELYLNNGILAFLRPYEVFKEKTLPMVVKAKELTPEEIVNALNKKLTYHSITVADVYVSRYWLGKLHNHIENGAELINSNDLGNILDDADEADSMKGAEEIKPHGNIEVSAKKREEVYKAAIYWLLKDPESCKGKRGDVTQVAWAKRIVEGRNEKPVSLGEDKIVKCLRDAMNGTNSEES